MSCTMTYIMKIWQLVSTMIQRFLFSVIKQRKHWYILLLNLSYNFFLDFDRSKDFDIVDGQIKYKNKFLQANKNLKAPEYDLLRLLDVLSYLLRSRQPEYNNVWNSTSNEINVCKNHWKNVFFNNETISFIILFSIR